MDSLIKGIQLNEEKLFYERFYALMRNRDLVAIFEQFGIEAFRRSAVLEGFENAVNLSGFNGSVCVEIGTFKGLTAIVLSRHFDRVVSIDIINDSQKYEIAKSVGADNIQFINVKDNVEKSEVISGLKFDAAFSDGDHAHDAEADFDLVKRCGRVLFHEYWDAQMPVKRLVDRLGGVGSGVEIYGKFALWTD